MNQTILIVEDEVRLAEILDDYLRREGYRTERARDGRRALEAWRSVRPDLILLDLMLPEIDGLEVARRVRSESSVPIIMLTARDEEVDKLVGLGLGADDYVVKPYSPREVVARIKAVLRRVEGQVTAPQRMIVGRLAIDADQYQVLCDGAKVSVTAAEVRLLALLAKEPGRVRYRAELLAASGTGERFADERTVDAHVKNLRRKLGSCADVVETVRGVGYRLRVS
ncbi:MAG: response regulator transcription factor [Trueperaceae bacterium]|nr:response regulator transcription factor [Trueperaceae bacterium]